MSSVELLQFEYEFDGNPIQDNIVVPNGFIYAGICNGVYLILKDTDTKRIYLKNDKGLLTYLSKSVDAFIDLCELLKKYNYQDGNRHDLQNQIISIDSMALDENDGLWKYILTSAFPE